MSGVHAKMERERLTADMDALTAEVSSSLRQAAVWKVERDQALARIAERDDVLDLLLSKADEVSYLCKQVVGGTCWAASVYDKLRKEYNEL